MTTRGNATWLAVLAGFFSLPLTAASSAVADPPPAAPDPVEAVAHATAEPVAARAASPADAELERMQARSSKLQAEAQLRQAELERELAALQAEQQRLQLEQQVAQQRQQNELLKLQLEQQRLEAEAALRRARAEEAAAESKAELETLQREAQLAQARQAAQLAEARAELERLQVDKQLADARRAEELAEARATIEELQIDKQLRDAELADELARSKAEVQRMAARRELEQAERQDELADLRAEHQELSARQQLRQAELQAQLHEAQAASQRATLEQTAAAMRVQSLKFNDQLRDRIADELVYREDPFVDGTLYVSDRRIELDGPIITGTADYVTDRIHFFNNESPDRPIFLVFDNCPGGSVMQGYRIVEAIEASEAPVHVVVKSFAGSMAAVITTLAEHSYAYPNAIIMHHQMSAGAFGNMTDLEERLETLQEWERRLAEPVAAKMGVSLAEFKRMMYENNSRGDWDEFADRAVELKWVNHIVTELREEGERERPKGDAPRPWWFSLFFQDDNGQKYVKLPPLAPMDAYFLYNPNDFYRVDGMR